jgi:hypothetical protein
MKMQKTAYELARSQVSTPPGIVDLFWRITHRYRAHFSRVLDLGAGDGRFAVGGRYASYEGLEIDMTRQPMPGLPQRATIRYGCAFKDEGSNYAACIGNPPYVRHHHLEEKWRDGVARRLQDQANIRLNRKCNLYIYFLFLALLKSRDDGLVSIVVPYEWVSRPSAAPLREFIRSNRWHVDVYRFRDSVFGKVLTTASISVIDKRNRDGHWHYRDLGLDGKITDLGHMTGSSRQALPYEGRGRLWAMRGMSPGTQKVFSLTEGERLHAGLTLDDVLACATSLRNVPPHLSRLTHATFRKYFIESGARCWLIRSHIGAEVSHRLWAYLRHIPPERRDTSTCNSRDCWYRYPLFETPALLVSTGFTSFGPKVLVNSVGAHGLGSVCGVYSPEGIGLCRLRSYLVSIDFEKQVVAHAKHLKKIEIRQLNGVLKGHQQQDKHRA